MKRGILFLTVLFFIVCAASYSVDLTDNENLALSQMAKKNNVSEKEMIALIIKNSIQNYIDGQYGSLEKYKASKNKVEKTTDKKVEELQQEAWSKNINLDGVN